MWGVNWIELAQICVCGGYWYDKFIFLDVSCEQTQFVFFKFNVHGSVHCKYPFDIFPTICNITQFIYFWKTALHVSGGISTHHQENTQLYLQYLVLVKPLLLPVAIVEELELV